MTRRSLEIRVGVTVVIASAILIIGIMWFQKFKLVEKRYHFFARFSEVGGLTEDDPIDVNGIELGRVRNIHLGRRGVVVELGIVENVQIPIDSRIVLRSIGIMGERYISIKTGAALATVQPGDTLVGEFQAGMSEVMGKAGKVLSELTESSRELHSILHSITVNEKLDSSMQNFHALSEKLLLITSENQPRLTQAIRKFEHASSKIDSLISKRYAALDSSLESMGKAGRQFEIAVDNLTEASDALKEIGEKLRSGSGTLGKLIVEEDFLERLDKTIANLDDLITDIKKHPGRYLSIHLF